MRKMVHVQIERPGLLWVCTLTRPDEYWDDPRNGMPLTTDTIKARGLSMGSALSRAARKWHRAHK